MRFLLLFLMKESLLTPLCYRVRAHPRVLQWMAQHTGEVVLPVKERDEIEDDLEYWQEIL